MAQEQVDRCLAVALFPSYLWTGDGVDGEMAGQQQSKKTNDRPMHDEQTMDRKDNAYAVENEGAGWRGSLPARSWRLLWAGGFS